MTQSNLRTALINIFQIEDKYVIPKQGNWWNPQDNAESGTWVAFTIKSSHPTVMPFLIQESNTIAASEHIVDIDLQIVGALAESMAQSVSLWSLRQDVHDAFEAIGCSLLADNLGHYVVSNFIQEGLNSVLAYNVRFAVVSQIEVSATQDKLTSATFTYTLN